MTLKFGFKNATNVLDSLTLPGAPKLTGGAYNTDGICIPETQVIASGHSNCYKAASSPHRDGSVVFARWHQCTPHI